ncbi:ATP-grasp domain-containing protein [Opacimonas viscosa]|uniref:ATP-grasp domain-containing protein n=1 Tax=Opacimonas viscosa TaxID=2961944 RepID=A0AA41X446_9ALTE|nr:ATP-grasp domain-containing protein [Opacimonas viscosa]MCP3429118.1 ATP-grasp domain-containing protein [Opacimonas viscosa]
MKILVIPSSTEVAFEVIRSLKDIKNIDIYGANTICAYSELPKNKCVTGIPYIDAESFIPSIQDLIEKNNITHIFPAHDSASLKLTQNANKLNAKVISSSFITNNIARSKRSTYEVLKGIVRVPKLYNKEDVLPFPLFVKPDVGQGSVGTFKLNSQKDIEKVTTNDLICEFLPGDEYTVDCISDSKGKLLDASPRKREAMRNGIAVATSLVKDKLEFIEFAEKINSVINFKGAWFFQVKRDSDNQLCLLEFATRIAGSMITSRFNGINYAELSLLIAEDIPVSTITNHLDVTLYRNLSYQFETDLDYDTIYSDFDDCLIFGDKVNTDLVKLFFIARNDGKKVHLITRHNGNLQEKLRTLRLIGLFDSIIHITDGTSKSNYINPKNAIFIDDSFRERYDVRKVHNIPCFSVDMIKGLTCLKN